jgi:hypothetical protein
VQSYRPIAEIIQDVIGDIQEIIRSEFRLAKAETRDELSKAAKSSGILAAGIVFGLYALGFLFLTTMFGLEVALAPWLSALIVALALTGIATVLVTLGSRVKQIHIPEKTVTTVKENVQRPGHSPSICIAPI